MKRIASTLIGLFLVALALGPAAALPPTRSVSPSASSLPSAIDAAKLANGSVSNAEFQRLDGVTSAIQTQIDSKLASSSTKLPPTPSGAGKTIYDNGSAYVALSACSDGQTLVWASGVPTCSAVTAAPSVPIIGSITGMGVSQVYLTANASGSAGSTSSGSALVVIAPAGSVWQLRSAITTAMTTSQTCTVYLRTATTPQGTRTSQLFSVYADTDAANTAKLTSTYTVGGSLVYVTGSVLCTFSYGGSVYIQVERLS